MTSYKDMPAMQKLAIAQAIFKAVSGVVSTKGDGLRSEVDAQVVGFYEATGAKSYDINIEGRKVGTMSVTVAKEVERTVLDLQDTDAFDEWLSSDEGLDAVNDWLSDNLEKFVNDHFKSTGEVPPGVAARTVTEPEHVKGTTLRVDPAKVARALQGELPTAIAGLLGGE